MDHRGGAKRDHLRAWRLFHVARNVRIGSSPEVNANPIVGLLCASKRTPAQSPVGILAKISAFYFEDEQSGAAAALAEPEHAIWDNIVLGAIFADLERLAGGGAA